jgi:hypothetical protein
MTSDEVQVSDQQALVIELMQALESGVHGDVLRRFFHEDASQIDIQVWWTHALGVAAWRACRAGEGCRTAADRAATSHLQRLDLHLPRGQDHPTGGVRLLRAVLVGVEVVSLTQPLAKLIIDLISAR